MGVPERRLTDEEVSAVLRRAAELDRVVGADAEGLDRHALERAAVEAGLSLDAVRRALDELDAGRLPLGPPPGRGAWPGATVVLERTLPVGADAVDQRLTTFLRRQLLRVVRRRGGVTVWEAAEGVVATVARGVDVLGRVQLKPVDRVTVTVEPEGSGSHARVELDFRTARRVKLRRAALGSGAGGAAALGGVAVAVTATELALVGVPLGAGVAAGTWANARSSYARQVEKATAAMELVLDRLEESSPPR